MMSMTDEISTAHSLTAQSAKEELYSNSNTDLGEGVTQVRDAPMFMSRNV